MFVQVVGEGQEYRGRIFPRSICFVMATVFVVLHLWSTSSLCVMQFWKEIHSEFTVKALKGQNSAFLQVKFIEFLSVNVNASRVCDIRYKKNDFIAFLLLHFSKFDIEWLCPDAFIFCQPKIKVHTNVLLPKRSPQIINYNPNKVLYSSPSLLYLSHPPPPPHPTPWEMNVTSSPLTPKNSVATLIDN